MEDNVIEDDRSHDDDEQPLFSLEGTDEPDESGEFVDRGGPLRLEGVEIPFEILEFGNGLLPDTMLQRIGVGSHRLHASAAAAFALLREQAAGAGIDLTCTDSYRTLAQQEELKLRKPTLSATPGRSVHGWGFAVDVSVGSPPKPFGMKVLRWLQDNGPALGWFLGRPKDEPWHWVYRGTHSGVPPAAADQIPESQLTGVPPTPSTPSTLSTLSTPSAPSTPSTPLAKIVRALLELPPGDQFDDAALEAVKHFQQANGLFVDGVVGPLTFAALCHVTAPTDRPELTINSTGDPVRWVQRRLGRTPDGAFGARTEASVIEFQRERGLTADGKVGPRTWAALVG
jgi:hypothetical protein